MPGDRLGCLQFAHGPTGGKVEHNKISFVTGFNFSKMFIFYQQSF